MTQWRCHTSKIKEGSPRSCSPRATSPVCALEKTSGVGKTLDQRTYGSNRDVPSGVRRDQQARSCGVRQARRHAASTGRPGIATISHVVRVCSPDRQAKKKGPGSPRLRKGEEPAMLHWVPGDHRPALTCRSMQTGHQKGPKGTF